MLIEILSHVDIRRAKNYSNVVLQFADSIATLNYPIVVVVPCVYRKDNMKMKDLYEYYGLKNKLKIVFLKTPLSKGTPRHFYTFFIIIAHAFRALGLFLKQKLFLDDAERILFSTSNDILIPYIIFIKLCGMSGVKVVPWEHEYLKRKRDYWIYKNSDFILTTNTEIKKDIINCVGYSEEKVILTFNPVSTKRLANEYNKKMARDNLNIDRKLRLIVYTGKLGTAIKEIEYILQSAVLLPSYFFILTGGTPRVIRYYRKLINMRGISNVIFTGFIYRYDDIKYYQYAADVLVAYYSKYDINIAYNLPAKICEYMSTKNPIITCNFPATRDLLNKNNVLFVEPENPKALAEGIDLLIRNKKLAKCLALNAYDTVKEITFEKRAKIILDYILKDI